MEVLSLIFLWASAAIIIPIVIAFWNRKRFKREAFGGFFLLRKVMESTKRRIQLMQILRLLNRIFLFLLIVLVFAEPIKRVMRLPGAAEGFAIFLDVSRVMQGVADQKSLAQLQKEGLAELLERIPSQSKGSIFFVSDRCEVWGLGPGSQQSTASAEEWLAALEDEIFPYANRPLEQQAIQTCLNRTQSLFLSKDILVSLISPLPDSIEISFLRDNNIQIDQLERPDPISTIDLPIVQNPTDAGVQLALPWPAAFESYLIDEQGSTEALGSLRDEIVVGGQRASWLFVESATTQDAWANDRLIALQDISKKEVVLWAQEETEGYLSLRSALRSHPRLEVVRQIEGRPQGKYVIIYGSYPYDLEFLENAWFFISPDAASVFAIRDRKRWSSRFTGESIQDSFEIESPEGDIFIKDYAFFNLDEFNVLEAFKDGAPALLEYRWDGPRVWVSPFNLEDLTTDLTLEASFIPYLYRHLEQWMGQNSQDDDSLTEELLWAMPGSTPLHPQVAKESRWPGLYISEQGVRVVNPIAASQNFLDFKNRDLEESSMIEESESLREQLFPYIALSILIELIFSVASGHVFFVLMTIFFATTFHQSAEATTLRRTAIAYLPGIEPDRKEALDQLVRTVSQRSNLDFSPAEKFNIEQLAKYALIFASSTKPLAAWKPQEREAIREYLDRGGLLVADDPLAMADSRFMKSFKKEMQQILPGRELKNIPRDDVIFRTFYLLREVSGRKLTSASIDGISLDERWVVLCSYNDLLGAILQNSQGDYSLSVSPYGLMQRRLSERLLLNFLMYGVAVDYKDDAIHLPHILKRRVR